MSDLDKLLSQCLSQHAVTVVVKPLSLSPSLCLLNPACLHSLLSSLVSSLRPSLHRSQCVTSFISSISLLTCLSFFFSSKMLLSNLRRGSRHTNSPKISLFRFHCQTLSLLFITASPSPSSLCSFCPALHVFCHVADENGSWFLLYSLQIHKIKEME